MCLLVLYLFIDDLGGIALFAHVRTCDIVKNGIVKKSKRGACEQKAATVLPNRTAAA